MKNDNNKLEVDALIKTCEETLNREANLLDALREFMRDSRGSTPSPQKCAKLAAWVRKHYPLMGEAQ